MIRTPSIIRRPSSSCPPPSPSPTVSRTLTPPSLFRPHFISRSAQISVAAADSLSPLNRDMAAANDHQDPRLAGIASAIRVIPDFPKPGIMFQDITTLLLDVEAFKDTIDLFVERYKDKGISVVAGIEARGFIFGPPLALAIGAKFVPLRKPKKLPGEVISEEYSLEYGTDKIEMHVGAVQAGERALVVDDLIATGGTLNAAIKLLERVGVEVYECACLIELPELKGRDRLGDKPLFVLVSSSIEAHDFGVGE
ncbi:Adenine phosphoribosyltransferase 1, chloroplastic [Linum perenne]